jgi:predicted dehydrogenase
MKDLKIAIIGCGAATERLHLPAAAGMAGLRVMALVDRDLGRAQLLATGHGIPHAVTDAALLPERPDGVLIALPHHLHAPVSKEFLRAGISVLVEKPMALSLADCHAMVEAALSGNAPLAVGLVRRFLPEVRLAKTVVESGVLGAIQSFDLREGSNHAWPSTTDALFRRETAGGGVLIDLGVHVLDTLLYWLGPMNVAEYADDSYGGVEAEVELRLHLANGAMGFVELSRTRELRNTFLIHGTEATLEVDLYRRALRLLVQGSSLDLKSPPDAFEGDVFRAQLSAWTEAIRTGRTPAVSGEEGLRSVALIEACYRQRRRLEFPWILLPNEILPNATAAGGVAP